MSWYLMERGWMDHRLLQEKEYDKRSAWCWLIENAAWEDHATAWQGKTIAVKRGQVPISMRKLCDAWGWSLGRVQRFLNVLKTDTMVDIKTDTGFCIITICNYDAYQKPENLTDTANDTAASTAADTATGTNIKKTNNSKKTNKHPLTPETGEGAAALFDELPIQHREHCRFDEFWPIFPRKEGKKKAKEAYDKARLRDSQDNIIFGAKAYRRQYDADDREDRDRFFKYAQGWLNDDRWRDFSERDDDDDDAPDLSKMTPQQHAEWVMRQMGDA